MNKPQGASKISKRRKLKLRRVQLAFKGRGYPKVLPMVWRKFNASSEEMYHVVEVSQALPGYYFQWVADTLKRRQLQAVLRKVSARKHRKQRK